MTETKDKTTGGNSAFEIMAGKCWLCTRPSEELICETCEALPDDPAAAAASDNWHAEERERKRRERWAHVVDRQYLETDPDLLPAIAAAIWPQLPRFDYRKGKGLTLLGHTGAGKTRLAVRALEASHKLGASCMVLRCAKMRIRLWESFAAASKVLAEAVRPDVLLLDDLGQGATTEQVDEVTLAILEDRTAAKKITICTTQFGDDRLVERFARQETGEAIARRCGQQFATVLNLNPKADA